MQFFLSTAWTCQLLWKELGLRIALKSWEDTPIGHFLLSSPVVMFRPSSVVYSYVIFWPSVAYCRNTISVLYYADDMQLHLFCNSQNPQGLHCHHNHLSDIQMWTAQYFLQLDATKTEIFVIYYEIVNSLITLSYPHNVFKYCRKPLFFFPITPPRQACWKKWCTHVQDIISHRFAERWNLLSLYLSFSA